MVHHKGHMRATYFRAFEAFVETDGDLDAQIEHEINYEQVMITVRQACGMMWGCTDVIPNLAYDELRDFLGKDFGRTFANAARA